MFEMIDKPAEVHRVLREINQAHAEVLAEFARIFNYAERGSITRHGLYCNGATNVPQIDFSCMISPEMFAEFALPYLREETSRYDAVEYHLDGPGAVQHLEPIVKNCRVDVIQWVPGAADQHRDWSELYRRIDDLGIGQLRGGDAEAMRQVWKTCRDKRLYWMLGAASAEEAQAVINGFKS